MVCDNPGKAAIKAGNLTLTAISGIFIFIIKKSKSARCGIMNIFEHVC
jgi:hypothetical protein